MRIAIDARELFGRPTGVGRYLKNILQVWQGMKLRHELFLYHIRDPKTELPPDLNRETFRSRPVPLGYSRVRSLWEQIELPGLLRKTRRTSSSPSLLDSAAASLSGSGRHPRHII